MFDPNPQSIEFYLKDLEKQARPTIQNFGAKPHRMGSTLRLVAVIGAVALILVVAPLA